ncbi:hypothetical protein AB0J35_57915 [Nonomuraea angiospora]|uniref:hypothetical protein n=1 Tax=Nonomuraea angiospora TaxID=46172 RepID=UPI003420E64A
MADSRIIVAIEFVDGARCQAVCRTGGCTAALGGEWRGGTYSILKLARAEQQWHRDWHHLQRDGGVASA